VARDVGRLKARTVVTRTKPGYYSDGGGLYLKVSGAAGRSWVFRYRVAGRLREMGLGSAHTVSLADARQAATECRKLRVQGVDPIDARLNERTRTKLETASGMMFRECAERYIAAHRVGWRNPKHAEQWRNTLATYAFPIFGDLPVQAIDLGLVMKAIEPIWAAKTETASRLRGRIENVLDWAATRGYRKGDNPARWRGHLENLLPKRTKVQRVEHHAALAYSQVGTFIEALRGQPGMAALALEFCILTATRTSETIGAQWGEIDLDGVVWTIPAERIKAGKEHRVPLSAPAVAILRKLAAARSSDFVFAGGKPGKPLSNMALLALLKRMGRPDLTVHGFRSAFRDWGAELTNFPREVCEMALAHAIGDKVEAAYRRGDLFSKRRQLMEAWARYCLTPRSQGEVVSLVRSGHAE
jgi:integrase